MPRLGFTPHTACGREQTRHLQTLLLRQTKRKQSVLSGGIPPSRLKAFMIGDLILQRSLSAIQAGGV
jgi:hypothetical protein